MSCLCPCCPHDVVTQLRSLQRALFGSDYMADVERWTMIGRRILAQLPIEQRKPFVDWVAASDERIDAYEHDQDAMGPMWKTRVG